MESINHIADIVLEYWEFLLFTPEEDLDPDLATKEEESLIASIESHWTQEEKTALQDAAKRRIANSEAIDPEDESLDRNLRFLTFIAMDRIDDIWML